MTEKKPELTDSISSGSGYVTNPLKQTIHDEKKEIDFNKLKGKFDALKKKIIKKFPFTKVLAILPPQSSSLFEEEENIPKEEVEKKLTHLIMLIPEEEYKNLNKIKPEIIKFVKEGGENLWIHIKTIEVDLWSYGLDSKFEFFDAIAASFPLHDDGLLGALRVANIHKNLVLNWLNVGRVRYVATYAIGGSLVRGTSDKTSDVDTFVIIDDTDVKRMSRIELLEKLRGKITYEFVKEATALASVNNILNVQVWLLTDFWQRVKDAEPVAFTFIRDGVPFYDRGTFIPWKRLLQTGRIKPSPEAIDLYMKEGERTGDLVKRRLLDAMIDIYYGVVTPTQAMMMLSGHAPPVPKTIVQEVKKVLVEKEKVMSEKELKILEKVVKHFKDYEHGKLKEISGREIDDLLKETNEFSKKIKELREKLERKVQEHQAEKIYEETFSLIKKIFGNKNQESLIENLENELIKKGKLPEKNLSIVRDIVNVKRKAKKLNQSEMQRIVRNSSELIQSLTEYLQRKDFVSLEKGIAQISFKDKKADIVSTDTGFFVITEQKVSKIDGEKESFIESNQKELEEALHKTKHRTKFNLPSKILKVLKKEFGDFEISF